MQNLYLWMIVSIGLSAFGFLVSLLEGLKQRRRVLESVPKDTSESILEDEPSPRSRLFGNTVTYVMLSLPSFAYTLLVAFLIVLYTPLTAVQQKVAVGAMLAMGISSMFANLGRSLFYEESMDGLNEWDEGSLDFFGQYNVLLVLPEPTTIYGLLYAILGFVFTGVFEDVSISVSMTAADSYFTGGLILGVSGIAAIVMGTVFRRIKPLYEDKEYFGKKVMYTVIPHFINIVGLGVAMVMMVFSGMI